MFLHLASNLEAWKSVCMFGPGSMVIWWQWILPHLILLCHQNYITKPTIFSAPFQFYFGSMATHFACPFSVLFWIAMLNLRIVLNAAAAHSNIQLVDFDFHLSILNQSSKHLGIHLSHQNPFQFIILINFQNIQQSSFGHNHIQYRSANLSRSLLTISKNVHRVAWHYKLWLLKCANVSDSRAIR